MTAADVIEAEIIDPDPGEPAWEWRTEYLHEMKD
jgi:hypothetical protein